MTLAYESAFERLQVRLRSERHTWLITGVAGFIGSNLLETLLRLDQRVVGLDNFATGHQRNIKEVQRAVTPAQWERFHFIDGDIRDPATCSHAMSFPEAVDHTGTGAIPVEFVLHQAALGSVPRSLADPITTNATNISGFLNVLTAARDACAKSFTYAASSSTYGDSPSLPKVEEVIGKPLSPYAVTKYVNELYADVFSRSYGFDSIGLRYFNVFGPRQDPNGAYAAVIPKWISALLNGESVIINGDGETSRDFSFIDNVVQANLLAATAAPEARNQVFNVAFGERTTLNSLFELLKNNLAQYGVDPATAPAYRAFRAGDVRHSLADVSKAKKLLGFEPTHSLSQGIARAIEWYVRQHAISSLERQD